MASTNSNIPMQTWSVGRYILRLPTSSLVTEQTQVLDGITITIEPASQIPWKAQLAKRAVELTKDGGSPIVAQYEGAAILVPCSI